MALKWGDIQELRSRVPREYAPWGEPRSLEPGYVRRLDAEPDDTAPKANAPTRSGAALSEFVATAAPDERVDFTPVIDRPSLAASPRSETLTDDAPEARTAAPKAPIFAAIPQAPSAQAETLAAIGQPDTRARETDRTIYNLGMNTTEVGSFIATGSMASRLAQLDEQQERKRKDDEKFALDRAREALERRLAAIDTELRAIAEDNDRIDTRRAEIRKEREAIEELRRLKAEGKFDPNDPAQAALLRAAKFSAGDVQAGDFDDKAKGREGELDGEDGKLKTRRDNNRKREGDLRREDREIRGTLREMDTAPTPERRAIAEAKAQTLAGALDISSAAASTTSMETREVAAEAVGQNENSLVRGVSTQDNESAVKAESIQQLSSADASDFDFSAPASSSLASTSAASIIAPTASFSRAPDAGAAFANAAAQTAQPQQLASNENTPSQEPLLPPSGPKAG